MMGADVPTTTPPALADVWAIVVGAGAGERMGADRPKAFVRFRGRTLLAASLAVFDDHPGVDGIVCVVPAGYEDRASLVVDDLLADKVAAAVAGGATRAASVAEGLAALPERAAYVLVHDAARPLVTAGVIDRVLAALAGGSRGGGPRRAGRRHGQARRRRPRSSRRSSATTSSPCRRRRGSGATCWRGRSPATTRARPTARRSPSAPGAASPWSRAIRATARSRRRPTSPAPEAP